MRGSLRSVVAFCLGTSALTLPAVAASFSVGGGTITTTQADNSVDNTGTGGAFELQANTVSSGDAIAITNVNTTAVDVGNLLPSTGSYSVTMQGSTLSSYSFFRSINGGPISFDSTGGAANTLSGSVALNVGVSSGSGGVSIKTGADVISGIGAGAGGIAISAVGSGTVSVDTIGATITSTGLYGVVAQSGSGNVIIGGLNGGMASSITATNGYGIFTSAVGNISITIAPSGSITALNGISMSGIDLSVDNFGTLAATNNAIDALTFGQLNVTLEAGSITSGRLLGSNNGNGDTFTIFGGANIAGATFDGSGGNNTLILAGSGNGTFSLASATNITAFQMLGSGIWTLTGASAAGGGWTVASGTLRAGGNITVNDVAVNGGVFDVNGQTVTVGALSGTGGTIALGSGSLSTAFVGTSTLASVINGTGSLTKQASGTLILTGTNTYGGGTTILGGTLQLGNGGTAGSIAGNVTGSGTLSFNRSDTVTFGGAISGNTIVRQSGTGTTILTGTNTYVGGTIVNAGKLQLGPGGTLGNGAPLTMNGGTLDLNNTNQTVSSASGSGGFITLGSGTLTTTSGFAGSLASIISGTGGLTANGGLIVLTGANTYTGGTIISGGSLTVGAGGSFGSLGTGTIVINNNGLLVFDRNDTVTVSDAIVTTVPNGSLGLTGGGTLILTGANTYNGGTTITLGTLQVGNGGASGTLGSGGVVDNDTLVFDRSDSFTVINSISGGGNLTQAGAGTLILNSFNTYSGTTTIGSGGTLQVGSGGTNGTLGSGNVVDNGVLIFNHSDSVSFAGVISGTGTLTQAGGGNLVLTGANTYTGGTTINSGATLQLGTPTIGGSILGNVLNNGKLQFDRSDTYVFAGNISGTGAVWVAGQGTAILTGNSSYTGDTTVFINANLQAGNGGTAGSLPNGLIHVGGGTVSFNRSDAYAFSGAITDAIDGTGLTGKLSQIGTGTLTLSGTNTYTGGTTVSAGTLHVTGSIANSTVTVASGATLNGTGTVGAATIQSGATLAPGNSIGTLTVNGNLSFSSGATYNVEISPTAADRTNVSGMASLNGTVLASVAAGTYNFGQRFTILNATGGVSGSFASLSGIPISLKGQLSYDANNAYLTLSPNALAPLLSNVTGNQQKLVAAIDAAVAAGNVPPAGFTALYTLSSPALSSALDQISGQATPNAVNAVGNSFLAFMSMTASGGSGTTGNFAPGSAYGDTDAPHRAQLGTGEMRIWSAVYGGHAGLSGDAASGAAGLSSNNIGLIGGADKRLADWLIAGITLGVGRQQFHSGNGMGDSNDYMIGVYGRAEAGNTYLAASFGYGWHQIKTLRIVTVSGSDALQGKQNADDVGGRVEAGWRLPLDETYSLIPYGAFAGESFASPAFTETAVSGASTFALSYGAQTTGLGRSELGAHLERGYGTEHGIVTADVRAAWAHQLDDLPFTQASFINLPGAAFQTVGVRPAGDTALLGLDLEVQNNSGLFFGIRGEGQFGAGTTLVEGLGNFGWRW